MTQTETMWLWKIEEGGEVHYVAAQSAKRALEVLVETMDLGDVAGFIQEHEPSVSDVLMTEKIRVSCDDMPAGKWPDGALCVVEATARQWCSMGESVVSSTAWV